MRRLDALVESSGLPIADVLDELRRALVAGRAVLEAPPGAGKTTIVPLALLGERWLEGNRILILEPRRLAARAAASRMAALLGEAVGETIGYRVRHDSCVSAATRIEVVTEGILTRMLQDDPFLEGVGLVVFDEYHERSLHADLALALTLDVIGSVRPDLKLLVMSATMEAARIAGFLDQAPLIRSEGKQFSVDVSYRPADPGERTVYHQARVVMEAARETTGDVLVFLPGEAEIRRLQRRLLDMGWSSHVDVLPLYGRLSLAEQDRAIRRSEDGRQKIVLATNIAETSLTIEGVTAVVDSGLVRRARYSAESGMTELHTGRIARSSANQRAGRAGRLSPGRCYRLWSILEDQHLADHESPEMLRADLAPLALELAVWGVTSAVDLRWLDPPLPARMRQAFDLLESLGAVDGHGNATPHGRRIARTPAHPRLSHMLASAKNGRERRVAAALAALLSEGDFLRGDKAADPDLRIRLDLLVDGPSSVAPHSIRGNAMSAVRRVVRSLIGRLPTRRDIVQTDIGSLLFSAYPDRLGKKASPTSIRLVSGDRVSLGSESGLVANPFVVACRIGGRAAERRLMLGAPVEESVVRNEAIDRIYWLRDICWDAALGRVVAEEREMLDELILSQKPFESPDIEQVTDVVMEAVRSSGLDLLGWTKEATELHHRLCFLHQHVDGWPDVGREALICQLEEWLRPYAGAIRTAEELRRLDLRVLLMNRIGWERKAALDELAPSHVQVPSGSTIRVDYSDPTCAVLRVRIQEMFGCSEVPQIAGGRVRLLLHLLSPAHRPVQITDDLSGFWRGAYLDVRGELRGRYPKHPWPEDPLAAEPTRHTKQRRIRQR